MRRTLSALGGPHDQPFSVSEADKLEELDQIRTTIPICPIVPDPGSWFTWDVSLKSLLQLAIQVERGEIRRPIDSILVHLRGAVEWRWTCPLCWALILGICGLIRVPHRRGVARSVIRLRSRITQVLNVNFLKVRFVEEQSYLISILYPKRNNLDNEP